MGLSDIFDSYSLQARLQPALLTLVPVFFTAAVWYPQQYSFAVGLAGVAISCGLAAFLAHLARRLGRRAETQLFQEWGGKPTTMWLRHRDNHLDQYTKSRYRAFLQQRVPGWPNPSEAQEAGNPQAADAVYDTAVKWLLEYARDTQKFALVFKENIAYGFRRNLYGLRAMGIVLALITLAININEQGTYFRANSGEVNFAGAILIVVCIVMLCCWTAVITKAWVRDAADSYARALLATCDAPPG